MACSTCTDLMERLDASSERLHVAVSKLTEIAGKKNPAYDDVLKTVRQIRVECSDIRDQWQQHQQKAHGALKETM